MNKKLIVTAGISGSGKSTFASDLVRREPTIYTIVNRDKIRELIFGYTEESIAEYYTRTDISACEKQVTKYEDTLIHEGLNLGKTVIVDATHLSVEYLRRFEFWNVPIEYKYFDVSLDDAIKRDSRRTRKVGAGVIQKQYDKFKSLKRLPDFEPISLKNDKNLPPCVIYDIDGTIAKMSGRSAYEWKRVGEDLTISNVVATIDWIADLDEKDRPTVIICTGRDGSCLAETIDWLKENNIYFDNIFIREPGDQRPDWIIKEEMWRVIAQNYHIIGMYDDRNQVVRRARALGLKVFQVEYGNF